MSFPNDAATPPFTRIKVRVGALVFCGDEVALIRRDRPGSVHYTPPGGNVEHGEDLLAALRRELAEELGLAPSQAREPELLWVVDQMVSRPGATPPPRKLHLIYRLHVTPEVRAGLATEEYDEVPGGHEIGLIQWIDHRTAAGLPIFPPIGPALAALPRPSAALADAALPAVTDDNYVWV
ncbi:NUDIX hydrolase [Actinomadura xylanilytica]|uniref:NUDIX hydrolase n=1 Tax=Actinomadura xylanilytica TaxID=887459 RepID=UPI00255B1656|nr:NUDIX domain-containing protein [Actinomadura xylanilytica]MDL4776838.1 NUDIX domain-containing protein [Actinomadura xylanilytica]